jgi:hypothetical protein
VIKDVDVKLSNCGGCKETREVFKQFDAIVMRPLGFFVHLKM